MGFYGNITNAAKAQFSFDKVYSNRYEADLGCGVDGIMAGRYILVEYDQNTATDAYPEYWYYNGQVYSNLQSVMLNDNLLITGPIEENRFTPTGNQTVVRIPRGQKAVDINTAVEYCQVTSDTGVCKFITKNAYEQYMTNTFKPIKFSNVSEYKAGKFFVRDDYFSTEANAVIERYTREAAFVEQKDVTADDLLEYSDASETADCDDTEIYYVLVPAEYNDGEFDIYAPIGKCVSSYKYNNSDSDKQSWAEWWGENSSRQRIYENAIEVANVTTTKYFRKQQYSTSKDYYLPLAEIFTEVTGLLDADHYQPNTYYYSPELEGTLTPHTLTTEFVLDTGDYNSGRRYFDNSPVSRGFVVDGYVRNPGIADSIEDVFMNDAQLLCKGMCFKVYKYHSYRSNKVEEFWIYKNNTWKELVFKNVVDDSGNVVSSTADTTYLMNFAIDMANYNSSRGYDSTVWQKVFSNGHEKYVMVAELNSVVPVFDIGVDAPTLSPITPHFDDDSTNVYYKLHWQPQWGFRVKAADWSLKGPTFNLEGQAHGAGEVYLRRQPQENESFMHVSDTTFYPSDESVVWATNNYNAATRKFDSTVYNPETSQWESVTESETMPTVPAAIYYNKDGFSSKKIAYSKDFITQGNQRYSTDIASTGWQNKDEIALTPTGQSGKTYDPHDGTVDSAACEDTQEISIMLPSLGDTIAHIWDMVYGGRETNDEIYETNKRNRDIGWEDARALLDRRGLRLVHANGEPNAYSVAEVDTLAGCINSAHDLLGMIISANSQARLEADIKSLSDDRIYFDTTRNKYYRRHLTYSYKPVDASNLALYAFKPANVVEDDFNPNLYYVKSGNTFSKLSATATFSASTPYYEKSADTYTKMNFDEFKPSDYFFLEYTGIPELDENPNNNMTMMNYCIEEVYQPAHDYYTVNEKGFEYVELSDTYEPGVFFYKSNGNYMTEFEDTPRKGIQYYSINEQKLIPVLNNPLAGNYRGIYVPGYYFVMTGENAFTLDNRDTYTPGETYYRPKEGIAGEDEEGNIEVEYVKIIEYEERVPLTREEYDANQELATALGKESYYYILENDKYIPYTKTWSEYRNSRPIPSLFAAVEKYQEVVREKVYTLEEVDPVKIVPYTTNTFYLKVEDEKGILMGYKPATRSDVIPTKFNQNVVLYAFGYGVTFNGTTYVTKDWCASLDEPFTLKSGVNINDVLEWAVKALSDFYVPELYHFKDENGNILLDRYPSKTRTDYFFINPTYTEGGTTKQTIVQQNLSDSLFYEPYKYYREGATGEFYLATEKYAEPGVDYYKKTQLFVYEDERGILEKGMPWQPATYTVPDEVTLATRDEVYELKEIPEFARNLNTMHGMLLKLNRYMEYDDSFTRDPRIGNGLLNQVKDLIANIGKLKPRTFVTVDDTGRMLETDWDTRQAATASVAKTANKSLLKDVAGDVFSEVANVASMRKQWITANLDGTPDKPILRIHHNFQAVTDTTSATNKNTDNVASSNASDNITLYTPIVDAMGHVVGKNTETVTLPYGFKTIKVTNDASTVTDAASTILAAGQVADNTQDTLTFAASNKWIKFDNNTEDTIKIGHEVHTITTSAKPATNLNTNSTNTITIQDLLFDAAGHVTANQKHTYTLPYGYKTFSDGTNESVADSCYDKFTFVGDNWTKVLVENDKLTISHIGPVTTAHTEVDDVEPSFGDTFTIVDWTFDDKGHKANSGTHTIKIPKGSYANTGNTGVITGIGFTDTTGAITSTSSFLGSVKLGAYTAPGAKTAEGNVSVAAASITTDTTLSSALSTLDDKIMAETVSRINAIKALDVAGASNIAASKTISGWSETDGKVTITTQDISIASSQINDLASTYSSTGTVAVNGKAIDAALKTLDGTVSGTGFVSSISQTDGKITATLRKLTADDIPELTLAKITDAGDLASKDSLTADDIPELTLEKITDAGTMAKETATDYVKKTEIGFTEEDETVSFIRSEDTFTYTEASGEGADAIPEVAFTVAQLMKKVAELEAEIKALKEAE